MALVASWEACTLFPLWSCETALVRSGNGTKESWKGWDTGVIARVTVTANSRTMACSSLRRSLEPLISRAMVRPTASPTTSTDATVTWSQRHCHSGLGGSTYIGLGPPVTVRRLDFPFPLMAMDELLPRFADATG